MIKIKAICYINVILKFSTGVPLNGHFLSASVYYLLCVRSPQGFLVKTVI